MKRLWAFLLSMVMVFSLFTPAFAEELVEETPTDKQEFYIKYMATNIRAVWDQIALEVNPAASNVSTYPRSFTADTTITVDGETYVVHCVKPVYAVDPLPTIKATSDYNQSATSLTNYVKNNLTYTQTNEEFTNARGLEFDTLSVDSLSKQYNSTGGKYTITGTIGDTQFSTTLTVSSAYADEPYVSIGEGRKITCDPANIEYSLDRRSWTSIRNGSSLPSSCSGETVYFRTPSNSYTSASDYISVYCKEDQQSPSGRLTLDSNSYSIWITNADQFSGCEFSIDGTNYSSKTVFENLLPNTRYTVYARYPSTRYMFPSQAISGTQSTKEGQKSELTYEKVSTSSTVYMQAKGTTAVSISNKQLTTAYTDTTVRQLKNDITTTARKTDVVTTLDVYMTLEETDSRDYNKIKFTMPSGMGLLQLRLHTPWFTVIRDTETTEVMVYEGVVDSTSTIKAWANGLTHIYKVTTKKTGEVTIEFPWEWPDRADLDGLQVSYISTDGKDSRKLNYAVTAGGIRFVMPDNGYFAIRNLNRPYPTIPFVDSQAHWAYSYICHAYETGLVAGTSATTFSPGSLVTRAQLVTLLARMRGYDDSKWYGDLPYTDVHRDDWYAGALSFCYAAGIIKPDSKEFDESAPVTRQQTVAILEKMFPYKGVLWHPFNCKDRGEVDTYALRPLDVMYTCGIITGTSPDTFSPNGNLTRAEIVTILYRLQVADYWQTKTSVLSGEKLDSKLVKSTPNIWVDDGAKYFSKTTDIQSAMQYFQTTTGVRPYLVTTTTAKVAEDIYKSKFADNGHMVILLTKLNDRGGVTMEVYVASDAATVITQSSVDILNDRFQEYWSKTTMTSEEAITAFFRNAADDIMATEVTTNPTGWVAPEPVGDRIIKEEPKPVEKQPVAYTGPINFHLTEPDYFTTLPYGFSDWKVVDSNWQSSTGYLGDFEVTLLKSGVYNCIRWHISASVDTMDMDILDEYFGMSIDFDEFLMFVLSAPNGVTEVIMWDPATGSTLETTEEYAKGEFLYNPPKSVVEQMTSKFQSQLAVERQ